MHARMRCGIAISPREIWRRGVGRTFQITATFASLTVTVSHYYFWIGQPMPVFLVLYDARKVVAYWLYVQNYFGVDPSRRPKAGVQSVTLRLPVANVFSEATVDLVWSPAWNQAMISEIGKMQLGLM